ncbi:protein of unknown function DUF909 [Segniliparus rotundus DSM 44985]|uniref:ESAT-6-like protein n=1 Tax=Segniliparus rotundus (strain ATCC BAA-972 / CDC 1076 / CIP 108378 / DSM 44985 / JCM 13578) TaxID=640132 RepID=D6ZDX0_SEGRD|nr:WXG100 family type VII secretion target [Segniliparus rotundus]ADG99377.1 protein of unknown function DUF909 [Segniliparus rotundus DSM 44985]
MVLQAEPERIRAVAGQESSWADELWNEVEKLSKKMSELTDSGWLGTASRSHASAWEEWTEAAKRVASALSEDSALLHEAANSYTSEDQDQADQLSSFNF